MSSATIIRINQVGRMGNHMAQLMFAVGLQKLCRQKIEIEGFDIPAWGLASPRSGYGSSKLSIGSHLSRVRLVASMINALRPASANIDGAILRCGNLLGPHAYDEFFPLRGGIETPRDCLLINIRLGDIAVPSHPYYGPLPISYYQYLVQKTGLAPIFMGELDASPYLEALRGTFPNADFLASTGPIPDFQTIRRAKHIAISVSSFSWLAAYLSDCESIHVPIAGMFDPRVRPEIDLLPIETRFIFHDIDTPVWDDRYSDFLAPLAPFREMQRREVRQLKRSAFARTAALNARIHLGLARRMVPPLFN